MVHLLTDWLTDGGDDAGQSTCFEETWLNKLRKKEDFRPEPVWWSPHPVSSGGTARIHQSLLHPKFHNKT